MICERRYKPYGELLAGTATTYGWTGNTGSRATLLQYSEQYNRRRHYSTKLKQWSTRDPLWPEESAYGYVNANPLTWADPSGTVSTERVLNCCKNKFRYQNKPVGSPPVDACDEFLRSLHSCNVSVTAACNVIASGCIDRALELNGDPTILCAVVVNESTNAGAQQTLEDKIAGAGWGSMNEAVCRIASSDPQDWGVGCASISPRHAATCLHNLKICRPDIYQKVLSGLGGKLPSNTVEWSKKLTNCDFAVKVAAACQYVERYCFREKVKGKRPIDFPVSWNVGAFIEARSDPKNRSLGWPDDVSGPNTFDDRVKCLIKAFRGIGRI